MIFKTGDIILVDSNRTGAKVVKFLMTAPTVYHHLFWKLTGRLKKERPNYYHAAMVLNNTTIIEQQREVEMDTTSSILNKKYVVFRYKSLTEEHKNKLVELSLADLGEGYGIAECFGKFLTWITGIKWFCRAFDMKDRAICIVRLCEWYKKATGVNFGVPDYNELTTKSVEWYCRNRWDWEIVGENPR